MTTAPDPKILAAAIEHMEAEIALFPEAEFPVEHEWTRAVVAAVRAYGPMREALSGLVGLAKMRGGNLHEYGAAIAAAEAALNPAGPA